MSTPPKSRKWEIDGNPLVPETEEELVSALNDVMAILRCVGGAVTIAADRAEVAPDHYVTTRYIFRWHSFVPAKRQEPVNEDQGGNA